jgi:hypothetical protein
MQEEWSEEEKRELVEMLAQRGALPATLERGSALFFSSELSRFLESLEEHIAVYLASMLAKRPERVLQILYRVDVAEEEAASLFNTCTPAALPHRLAALLMERQLAKLQSRRLWQERFAPEQSSR